MTDEQIRDLFDTNMNMTLKKLSLITGKTIEELKQILMGERG